ncbi:MAG TPA: MarC family NAAT transporter [Spongiibacteraceae bacterium]|nr:MarC family NAAT transporter [Spongiibacteraceae bacterium]
MDSVLPLLKAVGLGLTVLLPLANPLSTAALMLGLTRNMSSAEIRRQSIKTSIYVFWIMVIAFYGGQAIMNIFGISLPGLRIGGGLIVTYIGFRMLFPVPPPVEVAANAKHAGMHSEPAEDIAFVPLAMPTTAGPGTIAMLISVASSTHEGRFPPWVILVAPTLVFLLISLIVWLCLRSAERIMQICGKSGVEAVSRIMGFLLACMGVQFVINGVLEIVHIEMAS